MTGEVVQFPPKPERGRRKVERRMRKIIDPNTQVLGGITQAQAQEVIASLIQEGLIRTHKQDKSTS